MEDLAALAMAIFIGLFVIGIVSVVLAALSRRDKLSPFWGIGLAVVVSIGAYIVWPQSPALVAIPVVWGILASVIALWPKRK